MSALVRRIDGFDDDSYKPQIFNFGRYYEEKNGVNPETLQPVRKIRVVIPQEGNDLIPNTNESASRDLFKDNLRNNIGFISGALASTALAIGVFTTNVLDRFSESAKKFIELGLSVIAISLVTITANGLLKK